jgi:hypothetical protein
METNSIFSDDAHEDQGDHLSLGQYLCEIEGDIGEINSNLSKMGDNSGVDTSSAEAGKENQKDAAKYSSLNKTCYNAHVFRMEHDLEDLLHKYNLKCFQQKLESVVIDADNIDIQEELQSFKNDNQEADMQSEVPEDEATRFDTEMMEAQDVFADTISSDAPLDFESEEGTEVVTQGLIDEEDEDTLAEEPLYDVEPQFSQDIDPESTFAANEIVDMAEEEPPSPLGEETEVVTAGGSFENLEAEGQEMSAEEPVFALDEDIDLPMADASIESPEAEAQEMIAEEPIFALDEDIDLPAVDAFAPEHSETEVISSPDSEETSADGDYFEIMAQQQQDDESSGLPDETEMDANLDSASEISMDSAAEDPLSDDNVEEEFALGSDSGEMQDGDESLEFDFSLPPPSAEEEPEDMFSEAVMDEDVFAPETADDNEFENDMYADDPSEDIYEGDIESEARKQEVGVEVQNYLDSQEFKDQLREKIEEAIYALVNEKLPEMVEKVVDAEVDVIKEKIKSMVTEK